MINNESETSEDIGRPSRRMRRAHISSLMKAQGKPGEPNYAPGLRAQQKREARRVFNARREAERKSQERGGETDNAADGLSS